MNTPYKLEQVPFILKIVSPSDLPVDMDEIMGELTSEHPDKLFMSPYLFDIKDNSITFKMYYALK